MIPVEEIAYIVNCFEADNQFDLQENVEVYRAKIAKVRAWLDECGITPLAPDAAPLLSELADSGIEVLSVKPVYSRRRR